MCLAASWPVSGGLFAPAKIGVAIGEPIVVTASDTLDGLKEKVRQDIVALKGKLPSVRIRERKAKPAAETGEKKE